MHSTRHDPNLAALQAGAGLPGHVLDVVVLTSDSGVLATLREAAGPEHAIWHAPSADTAVDLLVGGRCCILIADLGALRGDAANLLDQLHSQFPELILLATGRRDEEHSVASLISDGRIYRFLHKPVSPARANLFLTAATRRYNELRHAEPVGMTMVKTVAARPNVTLIVVGVVALLVAATAAFVFWQSRQQLATPPPPPRQVGTLTTQEQIADYLARGQMAIVTDRLLDPRGNNAVEYFRDVLALQPDNADAKAGLLRVGAALEARVVEALEARNPAQGATALMTLQRAVPDYPKLDLLREELLTLSRSTRTPISVAPPPAPIQKRAVAPAPTQAPPAEPLTTQTDEQAPSNAAAPAETPAPAAQPVAPAEAPAATGPSASELDAIARLRGRGILIAPPGNNAYEQLLALRERYPESEELRTEQQQLAFAFLERTRTALAARDVDTARTFLSRVDRLVPNMSATKALQAQLATAQQQHDFATNVVPATRLKRTREVPPSYPREAQRLGLRGWVDVEFTVAPDGTTQDLVVRNAEPARTFDQSAVDAVERWRFEPVMRDGAAVAQRASVRIRFELK